MIDRIISTAIVVAFAAFAAWLIINAWFTSVTISNIQLPTL